ncbi:MAG: DUF4346 domain-containing protein [Candidatus Thermoplasmatota archaeon]|nr:DUF4346 domain-containing protein [Candidatus Thermoplasmatota archaeon]MBS3790017.1 DUF4346 domain-containing protein [Candidatus Thermoplasmatota archaeon]
MNGIEKLEAEENEKMEFDEKGFFVITVKDEIIVEHYLNVQKEGDLEVETGKLNKVITGESAKAICDTIVREGLVSRLDHAAYLGRELQKAEIALKNDFDYEQCESIEL